jgi:hypothetical protein
MTGGDVREQAAAALVVRGWAPTGGIATLGFRPCDRTTKAWRLPAACRGAKPPAKRVETLTFCGN